MEYRNNPEEQDLPYGRNYASPPPPPTQAPPLDDIPPLKPSNWLWQSIVVTILCCVPFPLGIIGVIYAARVDSLYFAGRYEESERMSRKARMWTLISIGVAFIYVVLWSIMFVTGSLPEYLEDIIENNVSGYNF